jgi:MFS family permease
MPLPPSSAGTEDKAVRWSALLVAALSSFLTPFMLSSINIALPAIGNHFKADAVLLSWVATSYLLAAAVALMPFGKLADIHGRKRIFLLGMLLFTLSSLLCGLAQSIEALIVFRVFQASASPWYSPQACHPDLGLSGLRARPGAGHHGGSRLPGLACGPLSAAG